MTNLMNACHLHSYATCIDIFVTVVFLSFYYRWRPLPLTPFFMPIFALTDTLSRLNGADFLTNFVHTDSQPNK